MSFCSLALRRFDGLQLVAERAVIASLESAFGALPLARFNQMFQTPGTYIRRLAAFGAAPVALHSQLILSLP